MSKDVVLTLRVPVEALKALQDVPLCACKVTDERPRVSSRGSQGFDDLKKRLDLICQRADLLLKESDAFPEFLDFLSHAENPTSKGAQE